MVGDAVRLEDRFKGTGQRCYQKVKSMAMSMSGEGYKLLQIKKRKNILKYFSTVWTGINVEIKITSNK